MSIRNTLLATLAALTIATGANAAPEYDQFGAVYKTIERDKIFYMPGRGKGEKHHPRRSDRVQLRYNCDREEYSLWIERPLQKVRKNRRRHEDDGSVTELFEFYIINHKQNVEFYRKEDAYEMRTKGRNATDQFTHRIENWEKIEISIPVIETDGVPYTFDTASLKTHKERFCK